MCTTCGCGSGQTRIGGVVVAAHEHDQFVPVHEHEHSLLLSHSHPHTHDHVHAHVHDHTAPKGEARIVKLERDILEKNNEFARANRAWFAAHGVQVLNLVSSPGSGKTTLLVKTIEALRGVRPVAVIEGDQETALDAQRIRATGAPAIQINTGKGCHLDAHMVGHALERLPVARGSLLLVENVGNLVCPAAFDLGEAHKVAVLSVTEGEDKPLKYPDMFRAASLMLLNKCDLLPHLDFDIDAAIAYAKRVNPSLEIIRVSARTGEGMADWLEWIERRRPAVEAQAEA
ncbi:MAG TPA: hydrogenase nickel incorporation protein HypB [Steroidobacteraceae bacterium]